MKNEHLFWVIFFYLVGFPTLLFSQDWNLVNDSIHTCSGTFYDPGGDNDYPINLGSISGTICPDIPGQCISVNFTSFDIADDQLFILDHYQSGNCDNLVIGAFDGTNSPGYIVATNPSGCLTFVFWSNSANNASGWTADISCIPCGSASNPPALSSDCYGAIDVVGCDPLSNSGSGGNFNDFVLNNGHGFDCAPGGVEHQSVWYRFTVSTSGVLAFTITPDGNNDINFALFGPNRVCCNLGNVKRCSGAAAGPETGMGNGASDNIEGVGGDGWVAPMNVNAGEDYILVIDNFSADGQGFTIDWEGSVQLGGVGTCCAPLPVTISGDTTICIGETTVLTANGIGITSYNWVAEDGGNISGSTTNASITATAPGTYLVTVANSASCTGTASISVILDDPGPAMDEPPDLTVCAGQPVSVQFTGQGSGFSWTNSNAAIGLGASGTGNLNFTAANVGAVQTGNITVTPTGGACPGYPETFTISVLPLPTMTQPANVSVCGGANVSVNFSGIAGATFSWTNSNANIGLAANGTGNLDFSAAQVIQNETATLSVTPVLAGCPGAPRTFQITVKPVPVLDPPPDVTACALEQVEVDFEATPAGAIFSWTNTNAAIGLPASGAGNISFTANNWPLVQTASVTVTPSLNGCAGQPKSFNISILPAPVADEPPDITVCENAPVSVVFSGTNGSSYSWENSNTAIGLGPSGTGTLLQFTAADVLGNSVAGTITVTPTKGGCAGEAVSFSVTVINCCATSAGALDTNAIAVCGPKTVTIIHLGNQNLEPNDTIRYILFSNPANPLGSIVQYSDTLQFPFLQGVMHFDSAYFAAAIAGNQLANDSIDTTDPCFSMSKNLEILWRQKPTITVGSPPAAVCRDGCVDVQFDFAGAPPFEFTWLVVQNGQILLSKNETAAGYQLIVTLCTADLTPPPAPGSINFQVNFFQDLFCSCGD